MLTTLRLLHVLAGAIWFGGVIVVTFFLMPSIGAAGPAGGQVMKGMADRKYPHVMMALMAITILSGGGLMWYDNKAFGGDWFATNMGRTISLGAAAAILAGIVGAAAARPAMTKMQQLAAAMAGGGTPEQAAQMKALQGRLVTTTRIVAILMVVAAVTMAVARYL